MKKTTWKKLFSRSKSRSVTRASKRGKTGNDPSGAGSTSEATESPSDPRQSPANEPQLADAQLSGSQLSSDRVSGVAGGPTLKKTVQSSASTPNVPLVRTSTNEDFMTDEVESQNFSENSRTEEKPASQGELREEPEAVIKPEPEAATEPESELLLEKKPEPVLVLERESESVPTPESELVLEREPPLELSLDTELESVPEPVLVLENEPAPSPKLVLEPEPATEEAVMATEPQVDTSDEETTNIVASKNRRNALQSTELSNVFVAGVGSESGSSRGGSSPQPNVERGNSDQKSSGSSSSGESMGPTIALDSVFRESNVLIVSGQELEEETEEDEEDSLEEQTLQDGDSATAEDLDIQPTVLLDGQPVLACQNAFSVGSGIDDLDENEMASSVTTVCSESSEVRVSTIGETLSGLGGEAELPAPIYFVPSSSLPTGVNVITVLRDCPGLGRDNFQEATVTEITNESSEGAVDEGNQLQQPPQLSNSEENIQAN